MKSLMIAVSALALGASAASAADLAARPYTKAPIAPAVYDWSGWYVGINGGGGWDHEGWSIPGGGPSITAFTGSGGTVGGQFGWRTQTGWLVWGLDFQGNWASIKGSATGTVASEYNYDILQSTVTSYETLAATAGYAVNNVLFYAKGGAAAVQSKFQDTYLLSSNYSASITSSRWGAMLGAGVEYGLTPNWTIGVDYIHIFGAGRVETLNNLGNSGSENIAINQDLDIVTARLNYKFGGPVVARY